jgi:hypothetical protein
VTDKRMPIIVDKNRKRAFWALAIVCFMVPVSAWLLLLGLQPGRPDMSWALVIFGVMGLVAFIGSAIAIIHTLRAPWRLELNRSHLTIFAPTYNLAIPWNQILGIGVDSVSQRLGCVLVFEELPVVVQGATFHGNSSRPSAVTNATTMQARMEENYRELGYHLGIPGRLLEIGPEALAELLQEGRTGQLWQKEKESQ